MPIFSPALKPVELHIPDGLLSLPVALAFWAVTIVLIFAASRRTHKELGERQIPLMGVMAAFIFAAQMITFPVAGGTSGHLLGGVLAAIMLGPWAGFLVMASVIALQALLFQDGGLVVMGANIFNMGFLTVLIGYGLYRALSGRSRVIRLATAGVAAWLSVVASALATALQLWISGTALLALVVPAMLSVHILIGLGEAFITMAALAFLLRTRPDLLAASQGSGTAGRAWIVAGFLTALVVVLLSPFASAYPDGLERVATDLGFMGESAPAPFRVFPDYSIPFLGETSASTIVAGVAGVLIVGTFMIALVASLRRRARV